MPLILMDSEVIQAWCAGMYIADKTHLVISDGADIGYSSIFRALKMRYLQCCVQNANDSPLLKPQASFCIREIYIVCVLS